MRYQPAVVLLLIFSMAVLALFPGIGELTGITGKDEYLLSIRTPMHMIEGGHGWLPWLDGEPRLKKPPLLYWLGKTSYELFGISLTSARMIGVFFAALLVTVTAALYWQLYHDIRGTLLAGFILLGMAGIMIDGRRYLLDIPVAALSILAVLLLLTWDRSRSIAYLAASMIILGLAFLAKGPVSLIFYLSGVFAWLTIRSSFSDEKFNWARYMSLLTIPVAMSLAWYTYIYQLYPEILKETLLEEARGRNIFRISIDPLLNLIVIALPWSLVALYLISRFIRAEKSDRNTAAVFLLIWLMFSILPFFFFKTFSRYLYGVLVPMALLATHLTIAYSGTLAYRNWLRTGAILALLIGLPLIAFVFWFRPVDLLLILTLLPVIAFIYTWWKAKNSHIMALSAILYWAALTSVVYPRMGINNLPDGITDRIEGEYTVLYAGPQPAMLPAAAGKGLRATSRLWTLPAEVLSNCQGILLFMPEEMLGMARKQMTDLSLTFQQLDSFKILSSRGSWLYFARKGTTFADWKRAIQEQDVDSLGSDILLLRSKPNHCLK